MNAVIAVLLPLPTAAAGNGKRKRPDELQRIGRTGERDAVLDDD